MIWKTQHLLEDLASNRNQSLVELARDISVPCHDFLVSCKLPGAPSMRPHECCSEVMDAANPTFTPEGVCYSTRPELNLKTNFTSQGMSFWVKVDLDKSPRKPIT